MIAPSIAMFLEQHYDRLKADWYFARRGELESFPNDPIRAGAHGSTTITNGVKIEAVAKYIHCFSTFDRDLVMEDPKYFFTY